MRWKQHQPYSSIWHEFDVNVPGDLPHGTRVKVIGGGFHVGEYGQVVRGVGGGRWLVQLESGAAFRLGYWILEVQK